MDEALIVYVGMLFTVFAVGLDWLNSDVDIKTFLGRE
jgi:hypothetical protein